MSLTGKAGGCDTSGVYAFLPKPEISSRVYAEAGEVPVYSREQVEGTVERCRDAQVYWGALSPSQRGKLLRRYRDFLLDARDEIAETVSAETGKPLAEVFAAEMMYVCDGIGYWSKNGGRYLADRRFRPHLLKTKLPMTTYKPRGVIGMITPWNFPLLLSIGEAMRSPALVVSNSSSYRPLYRETSVLVPPMSKPIDCAKPACSAIRA